MDWRRSPLIDAWWGEGNHPLCALLRLPLIPFAGAFAGGVALRTLLYSRGILRPKRLPVPVVSVGNLTVGGTGKTPMVRWVAGRLLEAGRRPLVFSSGFGAAAGSLDLDEEGASLARALPGVAIVQSRHGRRALFALFESRGQKPGSIVLDDGFQKRDLHRDLDIVMVDATRPFGSGWPIPAGPLREPASALRRAGCVVLSRTELADPAAVSALKSALERKLPGVPVLRQRHEASGLLVSGEAASALKGKGVWLISAIAHPRAFEATVGRLGARVLGHDAFRDHAPLPSAVVEKARARARAAGADLLLSSAKDAPKLEGQGAGTPPIDALDISVVFDDDPGILLDRMTALFPRDHAAPSQRA